MFMPIKDEDYCVSFMKIEQCFILCMMTVLDESRHLSKYGYITFVEFLDFICRMAIECITMVDTIEYKVQALLELLYKHLYANG